MKDVEEIKAAIDAGKKVCWSHEGYEVGKTEDGWYFIRCIDNDYTTGLTDVHGVLHENPKEFFILDPEFIINEEPFGSGIRYVARLNGSFCFAHAKFETATRIVEVFKEFSIYSRIAFKNAPNRLRQAFIFATGQAEPYFRYMR